MSKLVYGHEVATRQQSVWHTTMSLKYLQSSTRISGSSLNYSEMAGSIPFSPHGYLIPSQAHLFQGSCDLAPSFKTLGTIDRSAPQNSKSQHKIKWCEDLWPGESSPSERVLARPRTPSKAKRSSRGYPSWLKGTVHFTLEEENVEFPDDSDIKKIIWSRINQ